MTNRYFRDLPLRFLCVAPPSGARFVRENHVMEDLSVGLLFKKVGTPLVIWIIF